MQIKEKIEELRNIDNNKKKIPPRILEERRKKLNKKINDTIYIIGLIIVISIMIGTICNSINMSSQDKEYASKIQSTLQSGPIQKMLTNQETITFKGVEITKLATYDITGIVVGMEFFYFGGGANKISQKDLAVCWGPASSSEYISEIDTIYTQNDRFALFSFGKAYLEKYKEKAGHYVSNNHIIPMNNNVKSALNNVRKGDTVQILGWLVDCKGSNWKWGPSSLVRTDDGNGACEIILAEYLGIK